ncbi:MAG: CoA transferase [Xanthomonadales bacterium]|nr:CoA transferase [Xanthomonadales bacterium]NIX14001.1 CoA transferase [Xanthomonadales bacterium]
MHPAVRDLLVIETAGVLAGPLAGQFFAELGARVVKVENPRAGGDVTRQWRTPEEDPEETRTAYFCAANWGKASVALDLKSEAGRAVLDDLLDRADLWIDNFQPATLDRLQIRPDEIRERNPRLIHARIEAYGPGDDRPGYDAALQAESGLMSMNGTADSGPLKLPLAMVDILTSHQIKEAVLLALWERERTGLGGAVSASLYDSAVACLANQATNYLVTGKAPRRLGSGHPNIVPYGTVFECAGGKPVVVAVGNDRQFAALCEVLGSPELAGKPEYASNRQRVIHRGSLEGLLAKLLGTIDRESLVAKLEGRNVPAAAVLSIDEVMAAEASGPLLLRDEASGRAGLRSVAFKAVGGEFRSGLAPPPRLGQDSERVLSDILGYSPDRIAQALVDF